MISSLSNVDIIEPIYEGGSTIVYRGRSRVDNQPVTVKMLRGDYPTSRQLAGLRHEYEMLKELNVSGVVKAYGLEQWQNGLALILEDFGGQPLNELIAARQIDFTTSLQIAITLAETIGQIHQHHIIHKDIKPHNILVNLRTGDVKIVDFGIATRLSQENQRVGDPNLLEGTPAYMSPEQTGRMNRVTDYRTDFYSLGVTLYEMWTGVLPFRATDPLELIHSHIARMPLSPSQVSPTIPRPVSDIVLKLLSKAAEDRYQSSAGLKADLMECLKQWQATGSITPFPIGQHDVTGILRISQKLYGREAELDTLLAAFERAAQGSAELMLVSGYSGVGKSALVNEIHKPIARQRGYFITGKFDQYRRNVPYASVIQAFQELIRQIFTQSPEQVAHWKDRIVEAVGANGQIIIDVIPEVEQIIGQQPQVPELGPSEAQNRFKLTFQSFINVFAQPHHPLAIFLDDVQWADLASLKLIQLLAADPTSRYLLLICAFRDNEVSPAHPALIAFDEIRKAGASVSEIRLESLNLTHVNQLIADTLGRDPNKTLPLADLVRSKTDGNPFFLNQFLKSLYQEQLLSFDLHSTRWRWDLERIQAAAITDNVSVLMANNIRKLQPQTQRILQLAACIGNQFNLAILAVINEKSATATAAELWEAIREGLILPLDAEYRLFASQDTGPEADGDDDLKVTYKFLHDRVQQTAYSLIPEERTEQIHLSIGRLMLAHTPPDQRDEQIFEIINHLNVGVQHITDPAERIQLAQLNLLAGQKARASTAYESAITYLATGMELLPEDSWQARYALTLALHQVRSECEYLIGHFDTAEALFDLILDHAASHQDRAQVYITRMGLYTNVGRYAEGVAVGLAGLKLFGVEFPESAEEQQAAIGAGLQSAQQNLADRKIEDLLHAPELLDSDKRAVMQLLVSLGPLSFNVDPNIFALIILEMVNISLKYGNLDVSAYAYSSYGVILAGLLGDYQSAHAFGKLSIELNERFNNADLKNKLHLVLGTFIDHWRVHVRSSITYLKQAYLESVEIGDIVYAGFASMAIVYHKLSQGVALNDVANELRRYLPFVQQTKNEPVTAILAFFQQWIANLQGQTSGPASLDSATFNESLFLATLKQHNLFSLLNVHAVYKSQLLFIHGRYNEALELAIEAEQTIAVNAGAYFVHELVFYSSLIRSALYPTATAEEQQQYWAQLSRSRDQLKVWADNCPDNVSYKYALIQAEMARLAGDEEASELYDMAISQAETHGFTHHVAVANELAAKFYLLKGKPKFARSYLMEAYDMYLAWGASAKAQQLATTYPAFLAEGRSVTVTHEPSRTTIPRTGASVMTLHRHAGLLDVTTVIKAAQIISSEIILDQLLEKLMKIVVENAGAQKGFLILNRDSGLSIEAAIIADHEMSTARPGIPVEDSDDLCVAIVQFVARTKQLVVLQDASEPSLFANNPYIVAHQPKSLLSLPLIHQGHLTGVLYLENNLATNAFTPDRVELLGLLSLQGAIAIENALLYAHVQEMTKDLQHINERLEQSNSSLEGNVAQRTAELSRMNEQLQLELAERQRVEEERAHLQEEVIRIQAAMLDELSTPVIPLTNRIMVMPLIGSMDTRRAEQILTNLLNGVSEHGAEVVIIDITGVAIVNTSVAATLINAAQSIRLLGAQAVITGIRPEVAQTLVATGVDLKAIVTAGTLQSGIAYALKQSGEAHLFQSGQPKQNDAGKLFPGRR